MENEKKVFSLQKLNFFAIETNWSNHFYNYQTEENEIEILI